MNNRKLKHIVKLGEIWETLKQEGRFKELGIKVNKSQFGKIVKEINKFYASQIASGITVRLPARIGKVQVYYNKTKTYVNEDGSVWTSRKINWYATSKLYKEDPEAKAKHLRVRNEPEIYYDIDLNIKSRRFNNMQFFRFRPSRGLKRKMYECIDNGNFIYQYD